MFLVRSSIVPPAWGLRGLRTAYEYHYHYHYHYYYFKGVEYPIKIIINYNNLKIFIIIK